MQPHHMVPASHMCVAVCVHASVAGPVPSKDGVSQGDQGELGLELSGAYHTCMSCSPSLSQLGVLRIFWHKVCLE